MKWAIMKLSGFEFKVYVQNGCNDGILNFKYSRLTINNYILYLIYISNNITWCQNKTQFIFHFIATHNKLWKNKYCIADFVQIMKQKLMLN